MFNLHQVSQEELELLGNQYEQNTFESEVKAKI